MFITFWNGVPLSTGMHACMCMCCYNAMATLGSSLYGMETDGAGKTVRENSSVFCLIRLCWFPSAVKSEASVIRPRPRLWPQSPVSYTHLTLPTNREV